MHRTLNLNGEAIRNGFQWTQRTYQQANAAEKLVIDEQQDNRQIALFLARSLQAER